MVPLEESKAVCLTVRSLLGCLSSAVFNHYTVETDRLSRVLYQVDEIFVADEVAYEDVASQVLLEGVELGCSLLLDLVDSTEPAQSNLSRQKVSSLLRI